MGVERYVFAWIRSCIFHSEKKKMSMSGQMEALKEREVFLLFRLYPSIQTEHTVAVFRGDSIVFKEGKRQFLGGISELQES